MRLIRRGFILVPTAVAFLGALVVHGCRGDQMTTTSKYKVGQVWNYKTRPQEPKSTFTVVKVEPSEKLGTLVHISVVGLKMKNPQTKSGLSDTIAHMPFTEAAIDKSVTTLARENAALPDFQSGYDEWKSAYDNEKAGAFSVTVAEAVGGIESAFGGK